MQVKMGKVFDGEVFSLLSRTHFEHGCYDVVLSIVSIVSIVSLVSI